MAPCLYLNVLCHYIIAPCCSHLWLRRSHSVPIEGLIPTSLPGNENPIVFGLQARLSFPWPLTPARLGFSPIRIPDCPQGASSRFIPTVTPEYSRPSLSSPLPPPHCGLSPSGTLKEKVWGTKFYPVLQLCCDPRSSVGVGRERPERGVEASQSQDSWILRHLCHQPAVTLGKLPSSLRKGNSKPCLRHGAV